MTYPTPKETESGTLVHILIGANKKFLGVYSTLMNAQIAREKMKSEPDAKVYSYYVDNDLTFLRWNIWDEDKHAYVPLPATESPSGYTSSYPTA